MHLYSFYIFPDNKDVNTESRKTDDAFPLLELIELSGEVQKLSASRDRLCIKTSAASERFFCIGTSSYLTGFLLGQKCWDRNSRPGFF